MSKYPKMFKKNLILSFSILPWLLACGHDPIIVDQRGVDPRLYVADVRECEQYAEQVNSVEKVARGAAVGGVVGGLIGAAVGNSQTAGSVAGVGVVKGGTRGGINASREKKQVLRNCLSGRGYRVLN